MFKQLEIKSTTPNIEMLSPYKMYKCAMSRPPCQWEITLSALVLTVSRIHHWLVVSIPLKHMKVSWENIFPIYGNNNPNVPNHQPAPYTQYQNCQKIDDILSIPLYTKRVDFHIFQGHISRQTHTSYSLLPQ